MHVCMKLCRKVNFLDNQATVLLALQIFRGGQKLHPPPQRIPAETIGQSPRTTSPNSCALASCSPLSKLCSSSPPSAHSLRACRNSSTSIVVPCKCNIPCNTLKRDYLYYYSTATLAQWPRVHWTLGPWNHKPCHVTADRGIAPLTFSNSSAKLNTVYPIAPVCVQLEKTHKLMEFILRF